MEGPTFTLDAQTPVAAFEVTLCMEGPEVKNTQPKATIYASWVAPSGAAVIVTAENLDAVADPDDDDNPYFDEEDEPGPEGSLSVEVDTDDGPWEGRSGQRCQRAQVIQFDAPDLAQGESVELTWSARFGGNFYSGAYGDPLEDEHWIVNIQRL